MWRVLAVGSWNLSSSILRTFAWTKDFVPASMKMTKAQCWVRIHGLPMEYWQPKSIFSIPRGIGSPMKKNQGFFAMVLSDLPHQLLVERLGFAPFHSFCKMIGHLIANCRRCNPVVVVD